MKAISSPNYRWRVGEVEITRVLEFEAALFEPAVIHPEASPEIIARHRTWLEPTLMDPASGLLVFSFHSTVIRTARATILVDTCSGNDKERPHKPRYHRKNWPYLANLVAAGFMPEDIDYVLCTHLHADHVGWNTRLVGARWVPTFPNARYLFAGEEWEFWRHEKDECIADSVVPVVEAGQAVLVDADYVVDEWLRLEPTPGHTPGHVAVRLGTSAGEAVFSGDLMHRTVQVAEPQWSSRFCYDPAKARDTRRAFVERHADSGVLVLAAHFPTPGFIVKTDAGCRFAPTNGF